MIGPPWYVTGGNGNAPTGPASGTNPALVLLDDELLVPPLLLDVVLPVPLLVLPLEVVVPVLLLVLPLEVVVPVPVLVLPLEVVVPVPLLVLPLEVVVLAPLPVLEVVVSAPPVPVPPVLPWDPTPAVPPVPLDWLGDPPQDAPATTRPVKMNAAKGADARMKAPCGDDRRGPPA
jgi:hypothetical protein